MNIFSRVWNWLFRGDPPTLLVLPRVQVISKPVAGIPQVSAQVMPVTPVVQKETPEERFYRLSLFFGSEIPPAVAGEKTIRFPRPDAKAPEK